ncbi:MAG TPA: hypothetical protein VNO32_12210, partial [Candidatus Acidoferrum sp.]|nr:hypothetical protein [Candidatus Acidoferrum sp.]
MSTDLLIPARTNTRHYEGVLRISEALSACRDPKQIARTLADKLVEFIPFDHLDVQVFKRNSSEIEW